MGQLSVPALLPDMRRVDHTAIRQVRYPVFMLLGRHDLTTPSSVIEPWLEKLQAPLRFTAHGNAIQLGGNGALVS